METLTGLGFFNKGNNELNISSLIYFHCLADYLAGMLFPVYNPVHNLTEPTLIIQSLSLQNLFPALYPSPGLPIIPLAS